MRGSPSWFCTAKSGDLEISIQYVIADVLSYSAAYSMQISGGGVRATNSISSYGVVSTTLQQERITSSNTKHSELFVRALNGEEIELKLTNSEIGLREGHRITLVLAIRGNEWNYVGLINHNTNSHEFWHSRLNALLPETSSAGVYLCLIGALFLGYGILDNAKGASLIIGILLLLVGFALAVANGRAASQNRQVVAQIHAAFVDMRMRQQAFAAAQRSHQLQGQAAHAMAGRPH